MYRILYVDDESALVAATKTFLERSGDFIVDTAISANEAIGLLEKRQYDAIISEYQMQGIDGIELLKKVRTSGNTIPFIIFTELGREDVIVEAIDNGVNFYLQKGGNPEAQFIELTHKIRIAIDHQRIVEKVLSLNRLYSVLSATNKAIVYLRTEREFFSEICQIFVETGGFRMAWIGLADKDQKIIRPVASAGTINEYLNNINISTEDVPQGRGPTGMAYREGKSFISNDIANDTRMEPWRENALKLGYLASAAFPFAQGTKNAGVITLYAPITGFFDDQTISLLEELSAAISFALETLDREEQRTFFENELKKSELKYRLLFQTAQDGILILEGDTGEIIDANTFILDMLGYPRDYFIGKHLWELGFLKDKSLALNVFAKLTTERYIRYEDLPLETKEGKAIDVEFISNLYLVGDKRIIQCNIRDITDRKLAETAHHESEEKFRLLFTQMVEGGALHEIAYNSSGVPVDYRILDVNPAFEQILGLKREDVIGKTGMEAYGVTDPPYLDIYARVARTGEPAVFETYFPPMAKYFSISAYCPSKGRFATIFEDITEHKRAEEELKRKNDELNALNEECSLHEEELIKSEADLRQALSEKEVLLSEVHHRVKNNLTAFISLLSLDGSYEDTQAGRTLRKDLQNRARSMALIHETLYKTGNFANVDMEVYLNNLVRQIAGSYGETPGVRVVVTVADVTLDIARATTAGLIVNELVTNSFKYAFPPGFDCIAARGEPCTIRVSLSHDNGTDILAVADNGCGLPEGVDPLTTKSLGLRLVTFLARHQLRAEIQVRAERGTKFIFRLKDTGD
jgi:PAS domain S-box-containing protein